MRIIEINALDNGAHNNQEIMGAIPVPEGWAVIPDTMTIPSTYPFVNITVKDGKVTSMTANQEAYDAAMAEQEPEAGREPTTEEILYAMLGVSRYE